MKRKIYSKLLDWKNNNLKPLMVLGARQVGKTFILQVFCNNEFKHYKYLNLLNERSIVELYKSNIDSEEKYRQLKLLIGFDPEIPDSVIFIDEIQESEELLSDLKFFNEVHPKLRIVVAGSLLGIKLKRMNTPFPVGKVMMINLYPMDFEEFLMAIDRQDLIDEIIIHFHSLEKMPEQIHLLLINLYRQYLICGGMPEQVQNYLDNDQDISKINRSILFDINNAYIFDMRRYVKSDAETNKIESIYDSIPSQLGNNSNKFQYSKISKSARSVNYESAYSWLIQSGLIVNSYAVNKIEKPLKGFIDETIFKAYLCDVGLLINRLNINTIDIINDSVMMYKGVIAENYVAQQLFSKDIPLYYWRSDNTAELDFIIENEDGIIPIEVKSSENNMSKSLRFYMQKYDPVYAYRISTKNFGFDETTRIKSLPLYAAYLIS